MSTVLTRPRPITGSATLDAFLSSPPAAGDVLPSRLQVGLERFARPWWRRSALRILRDDAAPDAEASSIPEALASSEWFIVFISADGAVSERVQEQVAWWAEHKDPRRLLPVLTPGGPGAQNGHRGDPTAALAPSLLTALGTATRGVDLRWARDDTQLDLRDSHFRSAVAEIAATVRRVPKAQLQAEEARWRRLGVYSGRAAVALLVILTVAAFAFAVHTNGQRREEEAQRAAAEQETELARADEARARSQTQRARAGGSVARSRELAASAINVLDEDPELASLLALEAIDTAPSGNPAPLEAVAALREAIHRDKLRARVPVSPQAGPISLALSPDASTLAVVVGAEAVVRLYDVETWQVVWEHAEKKTPDSFGSIRFSPSGDRLALGIVDSTSIHARAGAKSGEDDGKGARVVILDAGTGAVVETLQFGPCPSLEVGPYSPDGVWLPVSVGDGAGCEDGFRPAEGEGWWVELLDPATGETQLTFPTTYLAEISWSADASRLAITPADGSGTQVVDMSDQSTLTTIPDVLRGVLDPDGTHVASIDVVGGYGINLHDVETGRQVDRLTGLSNFVTDIHFTADGRRLIAAAEGSTVAVWDLFTGELLHDLAGTDRAREVVYNEETEELYTGGGTNVAVFDLSGAAEGEFDTVTMGHWVQANGMAAYGGTGAFMGFDLSQGEGALVWPFDATTGKLGAERRFTYMGTAPAVLPDGRIVLADRRGLPDDPEMEQGGATVWDPADGSTEVLLGCWATYASLAQSSLGQTPVTCGEGEGEWFHMDGAFTDPSGATLLVTSVEGSLHFFDAKTLEPTGTSHLPEGLRAVVAFGGGWLLASDVETGVSAGPENLGVVDLESGEAVARVSGLEAAVSPDGGLLAVGSGTGAVTIHETGTWAETASVGAGDARVRGLAFSPDGSKLMTAATDGFVRIWNTVDGSELARIPLTGASDGHWLDSTHIVVGTSQGLWTTLTLEVGELRELATSRLTRGFTADECATYHVDPCPAG